MDLTLIRHARPEHIENASGPADPGLTEVGFRQARAAAGFVCGERIDAIYVSPMLRARQTSEPLERITGIKADVVQGVQEYDADDRSYIPVEVMRQDKERWKEFLASDGTATSNDFYQQVVDSIETIVGQHRGDRVVIVCHGGVINTWAAHVLGLGPGMFFDPEYTSVNRFAAASSGERSVISLNETSHLTGDLKLYR